MTLAAGTAYAAALTPVHFTLDWIPSGRHIGWYVALDKGFYEQEGLAVTISRGFGVEDGIRRLVAGDTDIDFNDIPSAILARARNGAPVKAVAVIYAKHPAAIFTLKKYHIVTPKDLEGKTLAESAGSVNLVLFPAFAKVAGIDAKKVHWAIVAPDAKMQVLLAGKVQGTLFYSMQLPLMEKATASLGGVNMMQFGDYMKLYSNGILVTDSYLTKNPDVVRRFIRASLKGWAYAFAHLDEAVDIMMKHQPLGDPKVARAEALIVKNLMASPDSKTHGFGYMDPARMRETRDLVLRLFDVDKKVPLKDVYSDAYLPPPPR
ncbi:MAG TPA: ABC transporter substrate-binding protein [Alphaproteobacteria bacterium]|nr:ABC transporter substrate-binding protein [Alphaproteobacteria bacterium]